jgi:outer membrane protein assembly factor BamB
MMFRLSVCGLAVLLSACSTLSWKPGPVGEKGSAWRRGWTLVESDREFFRLESGVTPVSYSGPVISGAKIIFGSERFGLRAVAKQTGKVLWQLPLPSVSVVPLVTDTAVFVGTDLGDFYRVNAESGRVEFQVSLSAPVQGSMLLVLDRVYVASADEAVHALDPKTGKLLWTYRRPAFSGTSIRGGGNLAFIAGKIWTGFSDGALVGLNPESGSLENERVFRDNLKFVDVDARVLGWKDQLLVANYDGKLRMLRKDLTTVWEFDAGGARTPLLEGDVIYHASSSGVVYAIQASSGKEIWQQPLRRGVPTGLALMEKDNQQFLAVASSEERAYLFAADTGKVLDSILLGRGSGSYSPLVADRETQAFYLLSAYSRLYQIRLGL